MSDNASTDGTQELLLSIQDQRLRVLTNETNIGIVGNFSRCVNEAKGDYLVLASDDNVFTPDFIDKCVELIRKQPGLPIVLSAYDVIVVDEFSKDERRIIPAILSKTLSTGIWDGTTVLAEYLSGRISAQLWSSIVRLDILRRNGGYSPHPCSADEATWIPFLLEGKAGYVAERCSTYLVHGASHSSTFSPDNRLKDLYDVMQEISLTAERKIAAPATRHRIQRLAQRYVVQQAMVTLVLYRRAGASLVGAIRTFWSWRPMLRQCTTRDFLAGLRLRSLVRIMLPTPFARLAMALGLDKLV